MANTIEFDRIFVRTNEAKFWLGSTRPNFGWGRFGQIQTNFDRGRRDQIWARVDSAKFQSRST